jgi:uncharacterized protein
LAEDENLSFRWRQDFIRTYLERDIPQLGPRIPAETVRRRRLWAVEIKRSSAPKSRKASTQLART